MVIVSALLKKIFYSMYCTEIYIYKTSNSNQHRKQTNKQATKTGRKKHNKRQPRTDQKRKTSESFLKTKCVENQKSKWIQWLAYYGNAYEFCNFDWPKEINLTKQSNNTFYLLLARRYSRWTFLAIFLNCLYLYNWARRLAELIVTSLLHEILIEFVRTKW